MAFLKPTRYILEVIPLFMLSTCVLAIEPDSTHILDWPMEQLKGTEVVTTSLKKDIKLHEASTAMYVLRGKDIERSGYTSIPEILRLVPGVQVARVDATKWAVSARGFNGVFANKLLVLIDGRSVYSPLFSGVFWDQQDVMLQDVDRIEVIRGPGASIWGANAVNGVINIITKHTEDTQGGVFQAGLGTEELGFSNVRYGGTIGDRGSYRVYSKFFRRDNSIRFDGTTANDGWQQYQSGFRTDWDMTESDYLTVQAGILLGSVGQMAAVLTRQTAPSYLSIDSTAHVGCGHLLARWEHDFSISNNVVVQGYIDHMQRQDVPSSGFLNSYDIDLYQRYKAGSRHFIMWGGGYRLQQDKYNPSRLMEVTPSRRSVSNISLFVQDDINVWRDRCRVTVGSKFEHNDYTGWEIQPNIRFLTELPARQVIWGAVSRAVRTPARTENDIHTFTEIMTGPGKNQFWISMNGTDSFQSEILIAHELGYRVNPSARTSVDIALFYNRYKRLRMYEPDVQNIRTLFDGYNWELPLIFTNNMNGQSAGAEVSCNLRFSDKWDCSIAYSYLKISVQPNDEQIRKNPLYSIMKLAGFYALPKGIEGESPQNQFVMHHEYKLTHQIQADAIVRYVDNLLSLGVQHYINLDVRLHWQLSQKFGLSIVGQNLLSRRLIEWNPTYSQVIPGQQERSVYADMNWSF